MRGCIDDRLGRIVVPVLPRRMDTLSPYLEDELPALRSSELKGKLRMMIRRKVTTLSMTVLTLTSLVMAADTDSNLLKNDGSLDRLFKQSGVYNASSTGKTPGFVVDPGWPQPLPNNWRLGQIGGLYVDQHDHIWVYNRPRTMTNEEAGLEGPVPGAVNQKGQPVNGLGQVRAYGSIADCCKAAPSVLELEFGRETATRLGRPCRSRLCGR